MPDFSLGPNYHYLLPDGNHKLYWQLEIYFLRTNIQSFCRWVEVRESTRSNYRSDITATRAYGKMFGGRFQSEYSKAKSSQSCC